MCRYITEDFSNKIRPTIGVEYRQKELVIEGVELKLNIWDTAGQEKYRAVTGTFFKFDKSNTGEATAVLSLSISPAAIRSKAWKGGSTKYTRTRRNIS